MENKFFRLKKIKAQVKQFAPVLFLVFALALIGVGVSHNPFLVKTKTAVSDAVMPIVDMMAAPVRWVRSGSAYVKDILRVHAENQRLRAENAKLVAWKNIALKVADDKKQLEKMLNYVPGKEVSYLTARVLADNGGTFARSLIVEAGSENGVTKGAVGVLPEGVLGRVAEVGSTVSRLLEITDYTSRIPVMVGEQRLLCILAGDNTDFPKLISIPEGAKINQGDRVVTSGHAGVFPSGLAIGTVVSNEPGDVAVMPFARARDAEYVRLVDFGLSGVLIEEAKCDCPLGE